MNLRGRLAAAVMIGGFLAAGLATAAPADAATSRPSATGGSLGAEVRAEYRTPDGITHGAVYLAAPGVSADQLYQRLQKANTRGLIAPSRFVPFDSSCNYGTAECLDGQAPPLVWNRNGYTNPQIYYHDTSSSAWPEGTVISQWNQSPNIHVAWAPNGCPGYSGTHCINVSDAYYGSTGWQGLTVYSWDSSRHFIDGRVYIEYNDSYSSNHKAVACQETGHSFGMGHNVDTGSCMYSVNPYSGAPDSDDYSLITHVLYP